MKSFRLVIALLSSVLAAEVLRADAIPLNVPETIAAQQRLIVARPTDAALYNDLGNLLFLDRRVAEAEEAYRQSLDLDPELTSARYNLALLLHQTDRPRRAEREYGTILKNDPEHAWSRYQMGVLLAERGRRSAAIRSYARSMRLEPRLTDPAFNPHIVENELAPSAVLWAFSNLSPASLAPRTYESPADVTTILLAAQEGKRRPERELKKQKRNRRKRIRRKTGKPGTQPTVEVESAATSKRRPAIDLEPAH